MMEKRSLKSIVVALSIVTACLLAGVAGMSWLLFQKQNELYQTEQNSAQKKQNEVFISQYKETLTATQESRQKLETYIVRGDADTVLLLETIEALAEQEGISVTTDVTVEKNTSTANALGVTLGTRGEYQKVMAFLAELQNLPHEIAFREVTLRRSSEIAGQSASWTLSVALTIKSFQP